MEITRKNLEDAVSSGIIAEKQAADLWKFLADIGADKPSFRFTHILYYLGGMIAIGAMTLFMNLGWERFGGKGLFLISLAYAGISVFLTEYFLSRKNLKIPAGIMATLAVALVPLGIYGIQVELGFWGPGMVYRDYHVFIDWRWMFMELVTLAAGAIMLWRYRLPFLVMPVAVTLWYMSMDLVPFIFGEDRSWELRQMVSMYFGLLMILLAFWIDVRSRKSDKDYPFWIYLFGVIAFWGGLSLLRSESELNKFFYMCINVLMILTGAVLSRRVFVVFGGLGLAGYLGHLSYRVFKDSMIFPFALTAIGLAIVFLGVIWQKHEERITGSLRLFLPQALRELIEKNR